MEELKKKDYKLFWEWDKEKNAYDMTFEFGFEGRKKNSGEREQHEYGDPRQNKLVKGMCLGSVQSLSHVRLFETHGL